MWNYLNFPQYFLQILLDFLKKLENLSSSPKVSCFSSQKRNSKPLADSVKLIKELVNFVVEKKFKIEKR